MFQTKLCTRLLRTAKGAARTKSTNFRYVESPPPVTFSRSNEYKTAKGLPVLDIWIDNKQVAKTIIKKDADNRYAAKEVDHFDEATEIGAFLTYKDSLFKTLKNSASDVSYKKLSFVLEFGFVQYRLHMQEIMSSPRKRFIISGDRLTGKTMTLSAMLINSMTQPDQGVTVPALHLSQWFQDTISTQMNVLSEGKYDFPETNTAFLKYFTEYNTHPANPNNECLKDIKLLEDERWTSQIYSFKGDSLLNVCRIGMQNPLLAHNIIDKIFETMSERNTQMNILVDNANLLCEIHSSKLEAHRNLEDKQWWNQTPHLPNEITLLRSLKKLIKFHKNGHVYLSIDERNKITDTVKSETSLDEPYQDIIIPNTPTELEYNCYLNFWRKHGVISSNMTKAEVDEFTSLTGRNYSDTYKMMFLV